MQVFSDEFEEYLGNLIERILKEKLDKYLQPNGDKVAQDNSDNNCINVVSASKVTGYKPGYLYQLVKSNCIPHFRIGKGAIRFSKKELESWIRAGRPNIHQEAINNMATNYIVNGRKKK